MSASDLVQSLHHLWDSEFPDIPWIKQELLINPNEFLNQSRSWKLFIEGGSGEYSISMLADNHTNIDDKFSFAIDAKDGSIIINEIDGPCKIDSIIIRQNNNCKKARVLCIEYNLESKDGVVIFNTTTNEKRLIEKLTNKLSYHPEPIAKLLLPTLVTLISNDARKLVAILDSANKNDSLQNSARGFLKKYELKYNAHGIKRTFEFWSETEKKTYLSEVADLIQYIHDNCSLHVSLGFGAVLGKIRNNDLIAHDDDLDILVGFDSKIVPDISSALERLKKCLKDSPWKVEGRFFSHLWVKLPCQIRADVFVGLFEGEHLSFYPSARHSLLRSDVFPTENDQLCEVTLPFPALSETYLEKTYGVDWRTPSIRFAHPWDRTQFSDIAGSSLDNIITTRGEVMTQTFKS